MGVSVKYLPFAIVALLSATLCTTLYLTISQGHVTDSVPYISDTGTLPPESCIFGQALNLLWIMISYAMYIKYRQISYLLNTYNMEEHSAMNKITFIIGLLAAFGSSIVANFQETNMFYTHWVGAVLVFGAGAVYQCLQTIIYVNLTAILGQKNMTKIRIGLSVISAVSFLMFIICAVMAFTHKKVSDGYLHWKKMDGGYTYHNISAISEWICGSTTMMYLMLFTEEFKKIAVHEPNIFSKNYNVEQIESTSEVQ